MGRPSYQSTGIKMPNNKIVEEVSDFIDRCALIIGQDAQDNHCDSLTNECVEFVSDSPIEQIFYCALKTKQKLCGIQDNEEGLVLYAEGAHAPGLTILPQYHIGEYRVDFYLSFEMRRGNRWHKRDVIVECDSQAFHERTERQRSYEKARDRFLQTKEYKIFHFTGLEIKRDPMRIATEVLFFLTGWDWDRGLPLAED